MSTSHRRCSPLLLACLTLAACQDQLVTPENSPSIDGPRPEFAQGDGGTWTVNDLGDPGDGTCDDTECTLREATEAAASGDKIVFTAGLTGDILLVDGPIEIEGKGLEIDGDGRIGVDGQQANRGFDLDGQGGGWLVTLKGMTVKNGFTEEDGGGIRVRNGADLRLENMMVTKNNAVQLGGGIWTEGEVTIINSAIDDNQGNFRGGGIYTSGALSVTSSSISRNRTGAIGGGILSLGTALITITRTTISGNEVAGDGASNLGGGIYMSAGELQIRSSTITGNSASGASSLGGGISETEANITVANSIIAGNKAAEDADCELHKGQYTSLGYNVTVATSSGIACNFSAATDRRLALSQIFTEVIEEDLKDNGGPTKTHAVIVRGRAMDTGYCPGETTDQRGLTRPVDVAAITNVADGCDIGAYEAQGPVIARTDLMVSQSANKTSVKAGDLLTYTVRVRNLGPEAAPNVVLTNVLSSGVTFVSATHAKGTHTAPPAGETGTVTWTLGTMADQANEFTEIKVTVRIKGKTSITNVASVTAEVIDPNTANNTASLQTTVAAGGKK